MNHRN